jgi:hypothetical protein
MATNFPGGIDTFVNPNATSSLDSPSHSGLHTDLGDAMTAVETYVLANPGGLVPIKTETYSAVSTVNVNDVFSTTYQNYKIVFAFTKSAAALDRIRLRASGSDNQNANYQSQYLEATGGSTALGREGNQTSWPLITNLATGKLQVAELTLFRPNQNTRTGGVWSAGSDVDDNANIKFQSRSFGHNEDYQATGFTHYVGTGTMTGVIRVYGFNNG